MPRPSGATSFAVAGNAVRFDTMVAGAEPLTPLALDVAAVPRFQLAGQAAWQLASGSRLELGCVRGASDGWLPGLEEVVLAGANGMVSKAVDAAAWTTGRVRWQAPRFSQTFAAELAGGSHISGRHHLVFVGREHELVVCTVACIGSPNDVACQQRAQQLLPQSSQLQLPPVSMLARAVDVASVHPSGALAVAVAAVLAAVGLVLWRRPRTRYHRGVSS